MSNDVRSTIIDILEKFSEERGIRFIWATERRPDGCMTVSFKSKDGRGYTRRLNHSELNMSDNLEVVTDAIIREVIANLCLEG